jgi:hypothetical protein
MAKNWLDAPHGGDAEVSHNLSLRGLKDVVDKVSVDVLDVLRSSILNPSNATSVTIRSLASEEGLQAWPSLFIYRY